jgi:hypothetical protein
MDACGETETATHLLIEALSLGLYMCPSIGVGQ